jgi:choice-of-anchor B domain-containing protein
VFDLTQLRDVKSPPAKFTETAHYDRIHSAHNIVMNEESGFAYVVGASMGGETCGGGLHMIDVREPKNPKFAGCFSDTRTGNARTGYSHDAQCIKYHGPDQEFVGREICFGSNETALSIADVTDKANPKPISTAAYPNVAYLHQGWVSDDHRHLYMNDEGDELAGSVARTRTLVWDISDLEDPILVKEYLGETAATDHNLYVKGNYVYESNYVSGLRILDISDPANPVEAGYFDTVPWGEDKPGFAGSWSNYPYFASGIVVVTSMHEGVFVVRYKGRRTIS